MNRPALPCPLRRASIRHALLACLMLAAPFAASLAASPYQKLAIVLPKNGQTVFSNPGHLDVEVKISPAPELATGDRIELLLDGTRVARIQGERFTLDHVDRGSHQLQARIVDSHDKVVVESAPVTFQMWQASRHFPARH